MKALAILLAAIMLGATGQVALKRGLNSVAVVGSRQVIRNLPRVFGNGYVLASVVLYAVSSALWLYSMTGLDLSFMYPLTSLSYVLTAVFAVLFLKERVSPTRWIGLFLIVVGSFLITRT